MEVTGMTISGNTASGNAANEGGGGVFNQGGTITITDTTISMNIADGSAGSGGGLLNNLGTISLDGTTLSGNTAVRAGGAIEVASGGGTLTLTDTDLTDNSTGASPGNGGGIHISGSDNSFITGGTISGNSAANEGGGLWF